VKYDVSVRRVLAVLATLAGPCLGACTTFDFPAPSGMATSDAGVTDATMEVDAGPDASPTTLLAPATAAQLCALTFQCPGLAQAIEASVVVPLATPLTPLNFSGCMDWLDGPIDANRVGLAKQRQILESIAAASGCAAAYAASPVQPIGPFDAAGTCASTTTSCSGADLETCSAEGTFDFPCAAPLLDQPGSCVVPPLSTTAICVTKGACSPGLSCSGSGDPTLLDCYKDGLSYTAYDCNVSGRTCATAACAFPGKLGEPCPGRGSDDACDGSFVKHCVGGLLAQTEFDCAAVGRACSLQSGVARCVGSADQCTPFDTNGDVNECGDGGSTISLCIGGVKTSFDCSTIHLMCIPANNTQTAHCG
jgi:hypothetical protein